MNGCTAEDRVILSGIADQFADFLLERRKKQEEVQEMKPKRSRRTPGLDCGYKSNYSCQYENVCKDRNEYVCEFDFEWIGK